LIALLSPQPNYKKLSHIRDCIEPQGINFYPLLTRIYKPNKEITNCLRTFDLTNHLGNVHIAISDRKIPPAFSTSDTADFYTADTLSINDYYPYGMEKPGRGSNISFSRRGFGGHEKDNEIKGLGNSYTTYFRQYDARLGRWLSIDPVTHPWQSPYMAMDGNPIALSDPLGAATGGGKGGNGNKNQSRYENCNLPNQGSEDYKWADGTNSNYLQDQNKATTKGAGEISASTAYNSTSYSFEGKMEGEGNGWHPPMAQEEKKANAGGRPDADGALTFSETYNWWKNGGGQPLKADLSKIDLSSITPNQFPGGVGSTQSFNLLFRGNASSGLVYGSITLKLYPNNTVRAFNDRYDFDFKPWNSLGNIVRNIENAIGKGVHGSGTPFPIIFYGTGTISSNRNIFSPDNQGLLKPWEPKY
jgi:RHS repeat-associated protein